MNSVISRSTPDRKKNANSIVFYCLAGSVLILVLSINLWYYKTRLITPTNNYYSQLALAFKHGGLYLQEKPSPALLALNNPYDYQARNGIDFPWDASLYGGRFYLYWGPIPALLLTVFDDMFISKIGDQHLTVLFTAGLFIYLFMFLLTVWHRHFRGLPAWTFLLAVLTVGLALPFAWVLSNPRIYEASISSGQFFFMGGCFWAYLSMSDRSLRPLKLLLASAHWACAIGSRITLVPAVAFCILLLLIAIVREDGPSITSKKLISATSALISPLAICGMALAWYNWARFGSVVEFGLRYQLTSTDYRNSGSMLFSTGNTLENLYNYLIHAIALTPNFPFVKATENMGTNERLAGLLFTVPFVMLALTAPWISTYSPIQEDDHARDGAQPGLWTWLILSAAGITVVNFLVILLYYYAAMRFLVDAVPSLLLLSAFAFWRGVQGIQSTILRVLYTTLSSLLALGSIISSILFTISLSQNRLLDVLKVVKYISPTFK